MSEIKLQAYKRKETGETPTDVNTSEGYSYPDSILAGMSWKGDSDEQGKKYITVENGNIKPEEKKELDKDQFEDNPDDFESVDGAFSGTILGIQTSIVSFYKHRRSWIINGILLILLIAYFVYFGYAMYYEFGSAASIQLLWMTIVGALFILIFKFNLWSKTIGYLLGKTKPVPPKISAGLSWLIGILIAVAVLIFVIVDAIVLSKKPYNLVSLSGITLCVLLVLITSNNPAKVKWRTVLWGINLQLILALVVLRWDVGYSIIDWISIRFVDFINYTDAGARFVFGQNFMVHWFAFKAMPVVVFMSSVIAILYHIGVMQRIIQAIGWVLQVLMDTTAAESMAAAGNIFVGNTEAPLLILPMLKNMTKSELHCLMVGGFATIAGSAFGTYVILGAPPQHLIAASVMSAPAALALAKLSYPETKKSKTTIADINEIQKRHRCGRILSQLHKQLPTYWWGDIVVIGICLHSIYSFPSPGCPYRNIIEAASSGAIQSIKLVANITVNILAFLAILEFVNESLRWMGHRVGLYDPELTFGLICSYLLYPLALCMGVELEFCRKVAEIMGIKAFINSTFAYKMLGDLRKNKILFDAHVASNMTYSHIRDNIVLWLPDGQNVTLVDGILSDRSEAIATFSLCGFASIDSIGIVLGALVALIPERKRDLSSLVIRAVVVGNLASFMTASFAGLLYRGD